MWFRVLEVTESRGALPAEYSHHIDMRMSEHQDGPACGGALVKDAAHAEVSCRRASIADSAIASHADDNNAADHLSGRHGYATVPCIAV